MTLEKEEGRTEALLRIYTVSRVFRFGQKTICHLILTVNSKVLLMEVQIFTKDMLLI